MAKRRSSLTPAFEYDESTAQYRWIVGPNKGRFVPRLVVRGAIDDYLENKAAYTRSVSENLRRREISIPQWQREMERTSAKVHLANAAAAKGGWHNLTQSDYGRVGQLVRSEFQYLRRFAVQIENRLPLDGRFMQRALQYAEAGRHTFYVFKDLEMERLGMDEERSIRHAQDSCDDCLFWEAEGWVPRGSSPHPGGTGRRCRRKCKCDKQHRRSDSERDVAVTQAMAIDPAAEEGQPNRRLFTSSEIVEQKRIAQEAEASALVQRADFHGFDPVVARNIVDVAAEYLDEFPAVKSNVRFLGGEAAGTENFLEAHADVIQRVARRENLSEEVVKETWRKRWAETHANHIATYTPLKGVRGITFKENWVQDESTLTALLKEEVRVGRFAPGHESIKGLIDHEMAHALDDLVKVSDDPVVELLFTEFSKLSFREQKEELSTLADKDTGEFIAQAWVEYRNSERPRDTSRAIGTLMQKRYNEIVGRGEL